MAYKSELVVWFDEVDKGDIGLVGGKGANLGEMVQSGFPVPNGFIVTSTAYFQYIRQNNLITKIKNLLSSANYDKPDYLSQISSHIKKLITEGEISDELSKEIIENYRHLGGSMRDALVAVRSSATAEDLPGASFAGQQETFLNVQGDAYLIHAIKEAWASLFNTRAIFYRHEQKFDHFKVGIAIPVQKMVTSDESGIMFTIDPVTNDKSKIVIEAIYGLGEMIVQGAVTPDHYEIAKSDLKILEKKISTQKVLMKKSGHLNKIVKVPSIVGRRQKISDKQIVELAKLGKKLEEHYFFPQDSEWAIENGKIYIVQTRPVTTINTEKKKNQEQEVDLGTSKTVILTGDPASPGISSGVVKIIHSAKEIDKVKQGDVLVAPQTNPDFVPAMKKAVAIVTDSGGRTCFAGSTLVLTSEGFISMQDLHNLPMNKKPKIYSYDVKRRKPTWKKVLSTQKNHLPSARITISQTGRAINNTIDVTYDHKFYTLNKRDLVKKPLYEILDNNESICLVDSLSKYSSSLVISNKLAYLLGALGTDGNIHLTKGVRAWRRGTVTFTQKSIPEKANFILSVNSYFSEIYGKGFTQRIKHSSSYLGGRLVQGTAMDYRCYSLSIALEIKKLLEELPLLALSFSEEAALSFLAGVIDGDGSFYKNRIHIYVGKTNILEGIIVACLRLKIVPQVTVNRTIYNVQIVERMSDILQHSQRIIKTPCEKELGTKLFAAKQIFADIPRQVNYKGRIKPYINYNLLIDSRKIKRDIIPIVGKALKKELNILINSSLRMQRVSLIKDLGEIDVFNVEVEATNELDHNFVVFTSRYSPLLVSNSHAAIVSRELGIPAVVGTEHATTKLKSGTVITVDGKSGTIYKGGHLITPSVHSSSNVVVPDLSTKTKVYVNLAEPERAAAVAAKHVDGIGLLRAEFMMAQIGTHPKKMIKDGKKIAFIQQLASGLEQFCKAFYPRPVVYRASDFKTNEYRNLIGGREYEPIEPNPMLGYRGAFRYINDPEVFKLELEAIKIVRNKKEFKNLWMMVPFVRTVSELERVRKLISAAGLYRSSTFKLWMMVEIPANVILLEDFLRVGIDGVSVGSNDLTMLLLGTDRDNSDVATEFDEKNPAVLWALEHIVKTCRKNGVTASICGQAASSYPSIVEKLVEWGVTSVSVSPDAVDHTRQVIYQVEKELKRK